MIKKTILGLAAIVAVLVVVVFMQPDVMNVARSAVIPAEPDVVFPHVNDLHKWQAWSPWAKLDPNAKNAFEGPAGGVGAKFAWSGNMEVGEGSMTITESKPNERIRFELVFVKPMAGDCDTLFTFKPEGLGTHVTWTMKATNNFMGKAMSLVMDCEKMCGDQFEQGFANLKAVVSAPPAR